ncbi:MAG TPA: hypothetical protein VGN75_04465, partial [Kaistia sp.]|nr:hypothetical protein [Kaistia sp.]
MRNSVTTRLVRQMAAQQKARVQATGYGQYVFKYDDTDYHFKIVADLGKTKATVTQSEIYGNESPILTTTELAYEKEVDIYPDGIGCPVPSY